MRKKKTKLFVEEGTQVSYRAPYYIIGNMQYHEDWYEINVGMFDLDELITAVEKHLVTTKRRDLHAV